MKRLVGLLVVSLALLLVACDSGPTEAEIQERIASEVEKQVAQLVLERLPRILLARSVDSDNQFYK